MRLADPSWLAWLWALTGVSVMGGLALAVAAGAFLLAYWQRLPLPVRFFPVSAVAGIAGAPAFTIRTDSISAVSNRRRKASMVRMEDFMA